MDERRFRVFRQELAAFSSDFAIEDFPEDPNLIGFTIDVEELFPLNVFYDSRDDQVVIFTGLGGLPAEDLAKILATAMSLNSFGAFTRGCVLGYDDEHAQLNLSRHLPMDNLAVPVFFEELKNFSLVTAEILDRFALDAEEQERRDEQEPEACTIPRNLLA